MGPHLMDQVTVTVKCTLVENLLMVLCPLHLLLPSKLNHLPMRIRVLTWHKSRTCSRSIFWYQPTRLISYATSIAQRFRTQRPSSPLRRGFYGAMKAFPSFLRLRRHCFEGFLACVLDCSRQWRGRREKEQAWGPVARGGTWPFASGFAWNRNLGSQDWIASGYFDLCRFGWFVGASLHSGD